MTDHQNLRWYSVPSPPGKPLPQWARSACLTTGGEVYLPVAMIGMGDVEAWLCLGYDGTEMLEYRKHIFAPAQWLAREAPAHADDINHIAQDIRDQFAKENATQPD